MSVKTYVEAPKTVDAIRLLTREDFEGALEWIRDQGYQATSVILEGSLLGQSYITIHQGQTPNRIMANWGQWLTYTEGGMFAVIDPGDFDHLYVSAEAIG
jgi:hypothetical protein